MAPEVRTVLRQVDDYVNSGEYDTAIARGIDALKSFDEEREFDNSKIILERLIEVSQNEGKLIQAAQLLDLLKVRTILSKNHNELHDLKSKYSDLPKTPLSELITTKIRNENLILETVEILDIFGEYSPLPEIPYLRFTNSDDAIKLIEDFYEEGRYLINLLDSSTSLHQTYNIDIGQPEEVNIVDREHIYKLQ